MVDFSVEVTAARGLVEGLSTQRSVADQVAQAPSEFSTHTLHLAPQDSQEWVSVQLVAM